MTRVGIDDNFFALGGDSIVSIQLVSRARRAGLSITPRAVFQHQTVAALAGRAVDGAVLRRRAAADGDGAAAASGRLLATPIMRWLQERGGPLDGSARRCCCGCRRGCSEEHLRAALQALLDHHDALRLRLDAGADGEWRLEIAPPGAVAAGALLRRVEVGELMAEGGPDWAGAALHGVIAAEAEAAERRLDPAAGLMLQAVWFDAGARAARAAAGCDPSSGGGRGVVADPGAGPCGGVAGGRVRGQAVALPARGTSFRRWAERLAAQARSAEVADELSFWRGMQSEPSLLLADGKLDPVRDTLGTAGHLTLEPAGRGDGRRC